MGKLVPFRKGRRARRWARPEAYLTPRQQRAAKRAVKQTRARWFPAVLVALPLAAFTAVLLWPLGGDGPDVAAATGAHLALRDGDIRTAAELDAEQPQIAPSALSAPRWAGGAGNARRGDTETARFTLCSGPVRVTCVVDGDTIWYRGTKIRIADLDTPEVTKPGCANEAALGRKATARLQALLNAGPFTLEPNTFGPSEDRYGRSLMLVTRGGMSLGDVLVREGLAEEWGGPRKVWC